MTAEEQLAASIARLKALQAEGKLGTPYFHFREVAKVSIQVVGAGSHAAKSEVMTRIQGLIRACLATREVATDSEEDSRQWKEKLQEEVKAFCFALLGTWPTGEELREMIGE